MLGNYAIRLSYRSYYNAKRLDIRLAVIWIVFFEL